MTGQAAIAPPLPGPVRRALGIVERNAIEIRRTPSPALAAVLEPLLYLLSIGVGVGHLVHDVPGIPARVGYAAYVAPALVATSAMNEAIGVTLFALYAKLRTLRTYEAIVTTSLDVRDVVHGEVCWAVCRAMFTVTSFVVILAALGLARSPWVLLCVPASAVVAFGFGPVGIVAATYLRGWPDMQIVQFVMLPMFLFSTTFYPLSVYPRAVQLCVELLPLYQATSLMRGLALGQFAPGELVAVGYLAVVGAVAMRGATRRMTSTLAA